MTAEERPPAERLLAAAEELFGQRSYARTGVADICARAGIATGSFYAYFGSKADIFAAVVRAINADLRMAMKEALEKADGGQRTRERECFRVYFEMMSERPWMDRIVRESEFVAPGLFREYYEHLTRGYARGVRAAQLAGEVDARYDPEVIAYAYTGIGNFVGMRWADWTSGGRVPEDVLDDVLELLGRGLAPLRQPRGRLTSRRLPGAATGGHRHRYYREPARCPCVDASPADGLVAARDSCRGSFGRGSLISFLFGVSRPRGRAMSDPTVPGRLPAGVTEEGDGIMIGHGPVRVDAFIDFLCPYCRRFELSSGPALAGLVAEGRINLVYHPMNFLDEASTTNYSTRAAAASGCAADGGRFAEFAHALFENQPPEGGPGLSDAELGNIGRAAGLADMAFTACVSDMPYRDWAPYVTARAIALGVEATPTVLVAGTVVEAEARSIAAAVADATGGR
jgi:AcrR family transcriptional regulator/protein-disulfide isomerase